MIVCSEHLLRNAYLYVRVTVLFTASYVIVLLMLTKTAEKSFWLKKKEQQLQPHEVSKERNRTLAFKSHFPAPRTSVLTPFLLFHQAIQKQLFSLTYCPNETWSMLFTSQLKDGAKCRSKKGLKKDLEKLMWLIKLSKLRRSLFLPLFCFPSTGHYGRTTQGRLWFDLKSIYEYVTA